MPSEIRPACRLCGHRDHWIPDHLVEAHGMSLGAYLNRFPGAPTASSEIAQFLANAELDPNRPAERPPRPEELRVDFAGVRVRVNADVPAEACLPLPAHFRMPTHGALGRDVADVAVALLRGRSVYVHGQAGCGKDAIFHAWSALTRTPGLIFSVDPSADIRSWFYSHEFDASGTRWELGVLMKALRFGYVSPTTGRRIPYVIVVTDLDRATKEQAESLRLVLDSIQRRVLGPDGEAYPVLEGTQLVFNGNTAGGGDHRGRYISANPMDASIFDRVERVYEFHLMDWADEGPIALAKFPELARVAPSVFTKMRDITKKLRDAIRKEELYGDFSHRGLCTVLGAAEDLAVVRGETDAGNLLRGGLRAFIDRLPDPETRQAAWRIADAHVPGGTVRRSQGAG